MLEIYCRPLLDQSYTTILDKLKPMLEDSEIYIAQGENVKTMYPRYTKKKYFCEIGKQAAINLEFSLEKKLSYNGKEIFWENTYIDWINQILNFQRDNSTYNLQDKLLYYSIEPKTTLKYIETREIIEEETKKYVHEYRKYLDLYKDTP